MRKLKPGECGLTKNKQPVCRTRKGLYRFVKRTSAQGRQALRGIAGALSGKGKKKRKGKGKRAGVPTGYALMKSHRKGSSVPKGKCFKTRGRLYCRMKGTGRVKAMKTT